MTNPHEQPTEFGQPYPPHPYGQPATPAAPKRGLPTWAIALLLVAGGLVLLCGGGAVVAAVTTDQPTGERPAATDAPTEDAPAGEPAAEEPEDEPEPESEPDLTAEQEQAIGMAQDYLAYSAFSRQGLIGQLEYEGFSTKEATFAVDYLDVRWKEQAAKMAEEYLEYSHFSRQGLIEQLEYEGFTTKQAEYGVEQAGL